ncbi:MAG: methyl-accepting chemotaxis protein [bacterium]
MNEKMKRTNYFIDKEFQFKYVLKIVIITLLTIVYTACIVGSAFLISLNEGLSFTQILLKHLSWMIILLIFNIVLVAIYFSHKIAGPLYRFEWALEKIAHGDLSIKVEIRKKDAFNPFKEALNTTVETLNKFVQEDEEIVKEISEIIKELQTELKKHKDLSQEKIIYLIEKLSHIDEKANKIIHPFKTKKEEK